jgi:hypothetical protein
MGKRELFLVLAFVVAGAGVYQLTVPRRPTDKPFSFAAAIDHLRPGSRRDRSTATATRSGRIPVPAGVEEVRIAGLTTLWVVGEERSDIQYELTVQASARDEPVAKSIADSVTLVTESVGTTLAVAARSSESGRWSSTGRLRLPRQWRVTVEATAEADLRNVGGAYLHFVSGDVRLQDIAGEVTGTHRNGDLLVNHVERLDLTLAQSNATIASVRDAVRLSVRGGSVLLSDVSAPSVLDGDHYKVTVRGVRASMSLTGTDSDVRLEQPRAPVRMEMRRSEIFAALDQPMPLTVYTTERPIRVEIRDALPISLNAMTTGDRRIDASALGLSPEFDARESRLIHRFGSDAEIVLRNQRDVIVITKRK